MGAKHPGDRAPPSDIDDGLTVSVDIQYLGFRDGFPREKREERRVGSGGSGARGSLLLDKHGGRIRLVYITV